LKTTINCKAIKKILSVCSFNPMPKKTKAITTYR